MEKILTSADIVTNSTTSISDVSTPYVDKIGDNLHFYMGIRASSLCYVRLVFNDDYEQYGGRYSLERLTLQQNMYALHLTVPEYTATAQEPEYRVSNFSITAKTCEGDVSKETFFNINQRRCLIETYTVSVKNYTLLDDFGGEFYIDEPGVKEKQLRNGDTYTIYANPYDKYKVLGEITRAPFTENYIPVSIMDSYTSNTYTCTGDITHYVIFGRLFRFNNTIDTQNAISGVKNELYDGSINMHAAGFFSNEWRLYLIGWGKGSSTRDKLIHTTRDEYYLLPRPRSSTEPTPSDSVYITTYATPGEGITLESYSVKDEYGNELSDGTSPYNIKNIFDNSSDEYSVKAVFIAEQPQVYYTVTFNLNGHGTPAPAQQTVQDGSTATEPQAPTAEWFTFEGWYTDSGCTNVYNFASQVHSNITLYAKWSGNFLIFTAEQANTKIGMLPAYYNPNLLVSLDEGETWSNWDCIDESWSLNKITLENIGDTLYVCGMNTTGFSQGQTGNTFIIDGKSSVSGNIMKLIDYTQDVLEIPNDYCFASLFANCTGLTSMPDLPATILKYGCYDSMFAGCTSLTRIPDNYLKVTNLSNAERCYWWMFGGCTGLIHIPSNLLPATVLSEECYAFMFFGCTNITTAPTLPAQTLVRMCYDEMFYNCENLNKIECLAVNGIGQYNSTSYWVEGVQTNSGTFIKHPSATTWERGVNGIPNGQGWSVQNAQV